MKRRDAIATGISHLAQNRLRAVLSILGIFIGIASVLCMMAIGDGAKKVIADGLETLDGIDQIQLRNLYGVYRRGRWHRITERLKYDDALAIESEVPNIRFVLPKNERYRILITTQEGRQSRPILDPLNIRQRDPLSTTRCMVTSMDVSGLSGVVHIRFYAKGDVLCAIQSFTDIGSPGTMTLS